jgi:hypothetical protein
MPSEFPKQASSQVLIPLIFKKKGKVMRPKVQVVVVSFLVSLKRERKGARIDISASTIHSYWLHAIL